MKNRTSLTTNTKARSLRRKLTPAEVILWQRLRNKQLNGWKFRRQEPIGNFIADFFCYDAGLVVELDGLSHEECHRRDQLKDEFLRNQGYRILRFRNEQIYDGLGEVLETILAACQQTIAPTQPPPEGEEFSSPIVLVGFMGCGKSSVARALARQLATNVTDLDSLIELHAGTTIAQIFASRGEEEFRRIETEALREALNDGSTPIIATGGGVVGREENRVLLKAAAARGALIVYLRAQPDVLAGRIRRQPGRRPLIDGDRVLNLEETRTRVQEILNRREPWYYEVANLIIDSGATTPHQIAQQIANVVKNQTTRL